MRVDTDAVWRWLEQVPDPEIPVVSVVDLGIVREVRVDPDGACTVVMTPTYSGCPAVTAIAADIRRVLAEHGVAGPRLETRLTPAWTTDWMSDAARAKLADYGIAPPGRRAQGYQAVGIAGLLRGSAQPAVACPHCGSADTRLVSQFGSTSCKALYTCQACREPFDHFKEH